MWNDAVFLGGGEAAASYVDAASEPLSEGGVRLNPGGRALMKFKSSRRYCVFTMGCSKVHRGVTIAWCLVESHWSFR